MPVEEKKIPYKVRAALDTDSKVDIDKIAIRSTKGIPMKDTTNGKTYLVQVVNGVLTATEVV